MTIRVTVELTDLEADALQSVAYAWLNSGDGLETLGMDGYQAQALNRAHEKLIAARKRAEHNHRRWTGRSGPWLKP